MGRAAPGTTRPQDVRDSALREAWLGGVKPCSLRAHHAVMCGRARMPHRAASCHRSLMSTAHAGWWGKTLHLLHFPVRGLYGPVPANLR